MDRQLVTDIVRQMDALLDARVGLVRDQTVREVTAYGNQLHMARALLSGETTVAGYTATLKAGEHVKAVKHEGQS